MSRTAAYLAALASCAVPDLDPASVQAVHPSATAGYDVAFVVDTRQRRWTVRVPRTAVDGARQDAVVGLLEPLARGVPFQVPLPRGFVPVPTGRAMVYPHLGGRPLVLAQVPPGAGLAAQLGRSIAALHDVDRGVFDEAGVPAYDANSSRERSLTQLDRAATTGQIPTSLLERWERALEDVTLWRFASVPTHGRLTGRAVLALFGDDDDATTGHVRAVTGWEDAKVADPADDLAALVDQCDPETVDSVLEAYAHARTGRPDPHLRRRAALAGELHRIDDLLSAVAAGSDDLVRRAAAALRDLQERVRDDDRLLPPPTAAPRTEPTHAAPVRTPHQPGQNGFAAPAGATAAPPSGATAAPTRADDSGATAAPPSGATAALGLTQEIPEHELAKIRKLAARPPDAAVRGDDDAPSPAPGAGPATGSASSRVTDGTDADVGPD